MADDLIELHDRIQFCRDEIVGLGTKAESFFSRFMKTRTEQIPDSETHNFFATLSAPPPISFRAKAGTIANELRACLDGLACQLALRNGENTKGVYFPISKSEEIFLDDGMRKIRKLSDLDQHKIIQLAPFKGGNDKLFFLHEYDRIRKHVRLGACATKSIGGKFGNLFSITGSGGLVIENFVINEQRIGRFSYNEDKTDFDNIGEERLIAREVPNIAPAEIKFGLVYSEPADLAGQPVQETLASFADTVSSIIRKFD